MCAKVIILLITNVSISGNTCHTENDKKICSIDQSTTYTHRTKDASDHSCDIVVVIIVLNISKMLNFQSIIYVIDALRCSDTCK